MQSLPKPLRAPFIRANFSGTLIVNGGDDAVTADAAIEGGVADLVSLGAQSLANPELPRRFAQGAPEYPGTATYYPGEERGHTDYPAPDG